MYAFFIVIKSFLGQQDGGGSGQVPTSFYVFLQGENHTRPEDVHLLSFVILFSPLIQLGTRHEVVTPIRHVTGSQLNEEERKELQMIKDEHLLAEYDFLLEGTHKTMSVPAHFHLHLVDLKKIL
jgi:hypothetical protein